MTHNDSSLRGEIAALGPWFHNIHLPDGTQTFPDHFLGDFPAFKWREIAACIPADLSGWTVLDIGCNAGFYSFELARRGALVTGIDCDPHYLRQAEWARSRMGLDGSVEFKQMQVYDLARTGEEYDLVLFMGVLYHLRYPLLGLDIVCRKTKRLLLLQIMTMPGEEVFEFRIDGWINDRECMLEPGWPKLAFIEHRFAGDPTNWWVPNHACIEAMLRSAGMRLTSRPAHEVYLCEPDPDHPSCIESWNAAEYASAAGLPLASIDAGS